MALRPEDITTVRINSLITLNRLAIETLQGRRPMTPEVKAHIEHVQIFGQAIRSFGCSTATLVKALRRFTVSSENALRL